MRVQKLRQKLELIFCLITGKDFLVLFCTLAFLCYSPIYAQDIPCDSAFYASEIQIIDDGYQSTISKFYTDEVSRELRKETLLSVKDRALGPIGFSILDNNIYCLDKLSLDLLKVDNDGKLTLVTSLKDKVDTSFVYEAGTISPSGKRFLLMGRDPDTGFDKELYSIRLDRDNFRTGRIIISHSIGIQFEAIAFSPLYGSVFGFDAVSHEIFSISSQSGQIAQYVQNSSSNLQSVNIEGIFFDKKNFLYGYGVPESDPDDLPNLYQIDVFTSKANFVSKLETGSSGDACSCPYSMNLTKQVQSPAILACDTISINYVIENMAGLVYEQKILSDTLPEGIQILNVRHLPRLAELISPLGQNILSIDMSYVFLGIDSAVVDIEIPQSYLGSWKSLAYVDTVPKALGTRIISRFSSDSLKNPEDLSVVPLTVELGDTIYLCDGTDVELIPKISGQSDNLFYLWGDGSTSPVLKTSQTGWQYLSVMSECEEASDSVWIDRRTEPLQIELGDDLEGEWGSAIRLNTISNATQGTQISWTTDPEIQLSCVDCFDPILPLTESAWIYATITDPNGCAATDSLYVTVSRSRDIEIANVFSPNQDGINDYFVIRGRVPASINSLRIVDRWGNQVFAMREAPINTELAGWDGKSSGQDVPSGVYYWQLKLEFPDQSQRILRGHVLLLR